MISILNKSNIYPGAIMILSFAKEFDRTRNPAIIDRPTDNIEIPKVSRIKSHLPPPPPHQDPLLQLMRQIEDIPKKNKGLIQHPYSIKARTLIYAQFLRLGPLTAELEKGLDKTLSIPSHIFVYSRQTIRDQTSIIFD